MLSGGLRALRTLRVAGICSGGTPVCSQSFRRPPFCPLSRTPPERPRSEVICLAKKSKKSGKTKTSKISIPQRASEPWTDVDAVMLLLLLVESYSKQTGKHLLEDADIVNIARDVFSAPFCLLAHDYTGQEDVRYTYANKAVLDMLQSSWEEVVGTPSTVFDESKLEEACKEGKLSGLTCKLRCKDGSQLEPQDVSLVSIVSPSDEVVGQMILFERWLLEDGSEAGPGFISASQLPSEEEVAAARNQVNTLASHVRSLKEERGLKNDDALVQEGVAELLKSKEALAALEERLATGSKNDDS